MITTTLNHIVWADCLDKRSHARLLKGLGKKKADNEPLPFSRIVEINGLDDAILCFAAEPQYAREVLFFGAWCARRVQHLMADPHSIAVLDVAERYVNGDATQEELKRAEDAARLAWEAARVTWNSPWESAARAALCSARSAWSARMAAREARMALPTELAAQTAEFLRIVNETEART